MITINSLSINTSAINILVSASTPSGFLFTKVLLWDSLTYRDYSKAIDLTSKLSQTSNQEDFVITAEELNKTSFKGIYFLEFTSNEAAPNTQTGLVANFIQYHECLMDKVLAISVKNCKVQDSQCGKVDTTAFIGTLIDALYTSVIFELVEESIDIITTLDELCEVCTNCPDSKSPSLTAGLGFKTIDNKVTLI